jgi:hypothetical protein
LSDRRSRRWPPFLTALKSSGGGGGWRRASGVGGAGLACGKDVGEEEQCRSSVQEALVNRVRHPVPPDLGRYRRCWDMEYHRLTVGERRWSARPQQTCSAVRGWGRVGRGDASPRVAAPPSPLPSPGCPRFSVLSPLLVERTDGEGNGCQSRKYKAEKALVFSPSPLGWTETIGVYFIL